MEPSSASFMINFRVADLDVLLSPSGGDHDSSFERLLAGGRVDGVILMEIRLEDSRVPRLQEAGRASEEPAALIERGTLPGQRGVTTTLAKLPEKDLDNPIDGPLARLAPTLGALLLLAANHEMMHAGQFSVVRRKLGKPVLF